MRQTVLLCLVLCVTPVYAGDIATERTQAATGVIIGYLTWINETISEYTDMIAEFEAAAYSLMEAADWFDVDAIDDVFAIYEDIEEVIQAGDALAHTAADAEQWFEDRYKTYEDYYTFIADRGYIDEEPVLDRLRQWNNTHRSTIRNTMEAHGIHADQIGKAEDRLKLLQEKSRTAEGRMQALQVGQEIAAEEIKQLHGLKEILMEQSNLHSSYFAAKAAMEADQDAHAEYLTRELMPTIVGNEVGAILP